MVYTYTPTYYSTLHDSITSLCKSILPFSMKKRRLPAAEHRLSMLQSDNLKWQQDSFHQIMNLMGLHREGILAETEVLAFRTHLLETLVASPVEHEHPSILRDKLVFLQELFYARCISEDEYQSSKRPLLLRLSAQGAEIEARVVIVSGQKDLKKNTEEHWSEIDLRDEKCSSSKENPRSKSKSKPGLPIKQIKGAASVLVFGSSHKQNASKGEKSIFEIHAQFTSSGFVNDGEKENPIWGSYQNVNSKESETKSILMQESLHADSVKQKSSAETAKRKPFKNLFQRDQKEGQSSSGVGGHDYSEERASKSVKKQWGFDGSKKWVRNDSDDETAPLPLNNKKSDGEAYPGGASHLVTSPIGEGPDTKQIKSKRHSTGAPADFFIDKILGDNIKKELSKIQAELSTTNPNLKFSDDQIEAISTKLPVNNADLKKFFPKSWCDRYGDVVLDVVKKEFKDHVGVMAAREKINSNSMRWTTFEDDNDYENHHPNLFAPPQDKEQNHSFPRKDGCTETNPFFHDHSYAEGKRINNENPFWIHPGAAVLNDVIKSSAGHLRK